MIVEITACISILILCVIRIIDIEKRYNEKKKVDGLIESIEKQLHDNKD